MRHAKNVVLSLLVLGTTTLGSILMPTPAHAATSMATVCGNDYHFIGSVPLRVPSYSTDWKYGRPGTITGYYNIYWNATARRNCGVAVASDKTWGKPMQRAVGIYARPYYPQMGDMSAPAPATYSYYAAPAYTEVQKPGRCISGAAAFGRNGNYGVAFFENRYC